MLLVGVLERSFFRVVLGWFDTQDVREILMWVFFFGIQFFVIRPVLELPKDETLYDIFLGVLYSLGYHI